MSEPDEILLGFARALRAAGLRVTQDRARTMLEAVAAVGLDDEKATYWAARAALCSSPDDLAVYDRVFTAWFHEEAPLTGNPRPRVSVVQSPLDDGESAAGDRDEVSVLRAMASETEVLRHRDIADLSEDERVRLAAMFASLRPRHPLRTAYRHRPWRRGTVDRQATLRRMRGSLGEPVDIAWQHRSKRPRRVVLLVDVSGSMSAYADSLLRLAHRMRTPQVEVFTLGTRLTRVTRAMRLRDADKAIAAAGEAVPDWSGGTRLGETLKAFLDRWGQRGLARGAVVVVFSDGWERGDATLLATQMERLARLAHRVVWVNPHKGAAGYQPVQLGMAAALPHCDDFVAGHSLAAFDELLGVLSRA
jgi:uncharacterized protein with von Willebrand factor type A (vWA) domain